MVAIAQQEAGDQALFQQVVVQQLPSVVDCRSQRLDGGFQCVATPWVDPRVGMRSLPFEHSLLAHNNPYALYK